MNNEIDLWSLLKFYLKQWYIILLLGLAGLGVGLAYATFFQTPLYKSDVKVTFINSSTQTSSRTVRDISNYADLVTSRSVLNKAITSSKEDITYDQLASSTTVTNDKNTDVIDITVTTPNPYRSAALASGILQAFEREVVNVYKIPQTEVRIIDDAQRIDTPVNVRHSLQFVISTSTGLLLSLVVLFFVFDFKSSRPNDDESDNDPKAPTAPVKRTIPDDAVDIPDHLLDELPRKVQRSGTRVPQKPGSRHHNQPVTKSIQ